MWVSRDKWLLFGGLLLILLGLAMLISPVRFIEIFWILIGIAVVLEGFVTLFSVRPVVASPSARKMLLIRGILGIAVGLVAVFLPLFIAGLVWTVMLSILAVEMVVSAVMEFLVIRDMRALGLSVRDYIIEAILLIAFAIILFIFPYKVGEIFIRVAGGAVIIAGCVSLFRWKRLAV